MSFSALFPRGRDRIPAAVAWAVGVACVVALVHRFRFATDLTDETFSIALPYRFVLGDKPFVDEVSIQQTAGIVLFPFVWLWVTLTGGSTGLVLFVRLVHLFFFKAIAALAVFAAARRWLDHRATAIGVSFLAFPFVPHSIPNVGYNVIGTSLLVVGTFLTAASVAEPRPKTRDRLLFGAGLAEGIMSFAYPPMGIAPVLAAPLVLLLSPTRRLAALAAFAAGGSVAVLAVSPSLAFGGVAGVRRALAWGIHAQGTHDSARLLHVLEGLRAVLPAFFVYALVAVGVAWIVRSRSMSAVVLPAIALAMALAFREGFTAHWGGIRTVTCAGAFAPAAIVLAKPNSAVWRGSALVVLPAFAAAVAAAVISTQGVDAAALGMNASMILFALLAARALERAGADATLAMLPAFALMFALVTCAYDFVYRDAPLAQLTERVRSGPFKGIYTTPDRAQTFAELSQITKAYDKPNGRILLLYATPGLYLFSTMRPSAHSVWEEAYGDQQGMLAYWERYPKGDGLVVMLKGSGQGAVDAVIAPAARRIEETGHFIVYRDR